MPHEQPAKYVICTAPRSGSWMLCSLLTQTGVAGLPREFFGPTMTEESRSNRLLARAHDLTEHIPRVLAAATTPNGVCGLKLTAQQAEIFHRRASDDAGRAFASLKEAFDAVLPGVRYIFLTRENKVAQAISFYRATIDQVWQKQVGQPRVERPIPYDRYSIQRCYQEGLAAEAYWDGYFRKHGIEAHRVSYEALTTDYEREIRAVLAFLGLPADTRVLPPETAKLAGAESLAWEREFRASGPLPHPHVLDPERLWAPY